MEEWLRPMLATAGVPPVIASRGDWQVEEKFDGWRAMVHVTSSGVVRVLGGRNGADYSGRLPEVEAELLGLLPNDTVVDGEIVGRDWGHVQSVMTTTLGGPRSREGIELVIFDITRLCTRDIRRVPLEQRRDALEDSNAFGFDNYDVDGEPLTSRGWAELLQRRKRVRLSTMVRANGERFHQEVVDAGGEGTVWKLLHSPYLSGQRSPNWWKRKHEATSEAVVTGFKPGNGEFQGMIGAIEFELLENGCASRASGMDMTMREQMTREQGKWIGEVIEIKHNGIMPSGSPRHPQFLRKRDDRVATAARTQGAPRSRHFRGGAAWKRNYGAMGPGKLAQCIRELNGHYGDAHQRVVDHGADPAVHLEAALRVARERGLTIPY